jgi:hypothetical protein
MIHSTAGTGLNIHSQTKQVAVTGQAAENTHNLTGIGQFASGMQGEWPSEMHAPTLRFLV